MKKTSLRKIFALPLTHSPLPAFAGALYIVVAALTPAGKTLATAWFIDTAISIVRDGTVRTAIFIPILLLTAFIAYDWLSPNARNLIFTKMELSLRQNLKALIIEKRAKLEYRCVEDSDTWDLISRVADNPETKIKDAYFNALAAFQFLISTISIMAILLAYAWWVGLLLIALCAPVFYLAMKSGKKQYDAEKEASKYDRRHKYLFDVMNARDYADERALFGYTGKLIKAYSDFYGKARKIRVNMYMKWMSRSKAPAILIGIVMTGVLYALLAPVIDGRMSPGVYIALVGAVNTMTFGFSWQLTSITDSLANANEYIKDYDSFFALPETAGALDKPAWGMNFNALEFRNVTFSYPGTERVVLNNISFRIENGKHYSFVGANGAGKTTITKLICGLYDNFGGEILIDGRDIRSLPQERLKAFASCIFQDFSRFQISLFDNIALGCLDSDAEDGLVRRAVESTQLAEAADGLPDGLSTKLGKIYDGGLDLSGGQWQRVALARAAASPAPLKILDEPTASLDPIAESAVYSQFEKISSGVTTVFISHRLASAKLADTIFVIEDGCVKETGSHDMLMGAGGLYAAMFESQRSWYA